MLNPLTHRKVLRIGIPGRATIVERGALDRGGSSFNLPMTLQVHVEGRAPYEVEDQWMVKAKHTIGLSGWIPVRVHPDDPDKVAIDWDGVMEQYEASKAARREALAEGGAVTGTNTDALAAAGLDAGTMDQVEQALAGLGIDLDLSNATVTVGQPQEITFGAPPQQDDDDVIGKLERLAALHRAGALTDAEFAEQKRRLLDDA